MRPQRVEDVLGQEALLKKGSPLRRLIDPSGSAISVPGSVILWGPAGCGKTTLAYLISKNSKRHFVELSAVSAGVKEVRQVVEEAKSRLAHEGVETVLFIDEVHRFSKAQQDALLPSVENRFIILVAATTENPYFSVISPLLSRSIMLTLEPLSPDDIEKLIQRALKSTDGLNSKVSIDDDAKDMLVKLSGHDARKTLTILEAAAGVNKKITVKTLEQALDIAYIKYDRAGDQHYDITSAFIKSMRGSDVDASLHYLARMIVAGEDPRFIARRIMIAASEEVAMADPLALVVATSAAQAVERIGFPEAQLILAQAVIHIALAPKSNAVTLAIGQAVLDVKSGKDGTVPKHLRDAHYSGSKTIGHGLDYKYAHDFPGHFVKQQYLPDELLGTHYYNPTAHGREKHFSQTLEKLRSVLG
ncbi:MAG: replication-associated recombination protein A [Candidatus Ancillula sp.]|jgi:putative ATPase|nr:replication-associated recombination protein A [Candidatus Ancillula sp.]